MQRTLVVLSQPVVFLRVQCNFHINSSNEMTAVLNFQCFMSLYHFLGLYGNLKGKVKEELRIPGCKREKVGI